VTGLFRSSDAEDKQVIILVTLIICIIIAIFLNFVNVKSDYDDLLDFYSGFLGRQVLIRKSLLFKSLFKFC
jgi:hypothetical protein